jgi:hypothetical protein
MARDEYAAWIGYIAAGDVRQCFELAPGCKPGR